MKERVKVSYFVCIRKKKHPFRSQRKVVIMPSWIWCGPKMILLLSTMYVLLYFDFNPYHILYLSPWLKVFRIIPEFSILRLCKVSLKKLNKVD